MMLWSMFSAMLLSDNLYAQSILPDVAQVVHLYLHVPHFVTRLSVDVDSFLMSSDSHCQDTWTVNCSKIRIILMNVPACKKFIISI